MIFCDKYFLEENTIRGIGVWGSDESGYFREDKTHLNASDDHVCKNHNATDEEIKAQRGPIEITKEEALKYGR